VIKTFEFRLAKIGVARKSEK